MAPCLPLIERLAFEFIIDLAQDIEGRINGLSVPSMGSLHGPRDYATPNPGGECCSTDATISCRLLAR